MSDKLQKLIASVKSRRTRTGLVMADRFFRDVQKCFDGGICPLGEQPQDQDEWSSAFKKAEQTLTFRNSDMKILKDTFKSKSGVDYLAQFDAVVTTPRRDRDGDIMESKGAEIDPAMPFLLHHAPMLLVGKRVKTLEHSERVVRCRFNIYDVPLARDNMPLLKAGAYRISHGFDAIDFEMLEDEKGWHFLKFLIFETSGVSIPSNVDAHIEGFTEKSFETDLMKQWYATNREKMGTGRKSTGTVPADIEPEAPCTCKKNRGNKPLEDPRVTKDFDVERQHVEAARLEYDWISRFCSCEVKQLVNFGTFARRIKMGSFLTGLKHVLAESSEVDTRRLTRGGLETPLEYETIQLNSKLTDHFLVDGISFRKTGSKVPFAVKFVREWNGEFVELYCARKDADVLDGYLCEAWKWADEHNFLKGEAFSLSGTFLPKSSEDWSDLFLEPENEREVKKVVDLINSKGKDCPNHGMVMAGPPGTGKTLSCRQIRNYANATFIWIGGKDAYYFGGVNAVVHAFEMAKELAPAVIVMEDIDASLQSRHAIDVLKTEMDGVAKSSGVITVMTTNEPKSFPDALLDRPGRFHDFLKFDLPKDEVRTKMLKKWLPELTGKALAQAVTETKGYSGAHVYHLCQYAKGICESDEIQVNDAVVKALKKISDQRQLINDELTRDRVIGRRSFREDAANPSKEFVVTKSFSGSVTHSEPESQSVDELERQLVVALKSAGIDRIRESHRILSLVLESEKDHIAANEFEALLA